MLLLCMAVPLALRWSAWINAEMVIAAWWAIWCIALSLFLYNGWLVTHEFQKPAFSSLRPTKGEMMIRGMLAQVAFGVLWATVYTAPLARPVWFVHWLHG